MTGKRLARRLKPARSKGYPRLSPPADSIRRTSQRWFGPFVPSQWTSAAGLKNREAPSPTRRSKLSFAPSGMPLLRRDLDHPRNDQQHDLHSLGRAVGDEEAVADA